MTRRANSASAACLFFFFIQLCQAAGQLLLQKEVSACRNSPNHKQRCVYSVPQLTGSAVSHLSPWLRLPATHLPASFLHAPPSDAAYNAQPQQTSRSCLQAWHARLRQRNTQRNKQCTQLLQRPTLLCGTTSSWTTCPHSCSFSLQAATALATYVNSSTCCCTTAAAAAATAVAQHEPIP